MGNRLSLSFYGDAILKMQKQVIMDTYDDLENESPSLLLASYQSFCSDA
jgi:hypothetical protein